MICLRKYHLKWYFNENISIHQPGLNELNRGVIIIVVKGSCNEIWSLTNTYVLTLTAILWNPYIHCWPWVRNIFNLGHKLATLMWQIYFHAFLELLNAFAWRYRTTFRFNSTMWNVVSWITLALPSPDPGRNMLSTFWPQMHYCPFAKSYQQPH